MEFAKKVEYLLDTLGASANDIAQYAGCDRSNISRLKSGARIPRPASPTVSKFLSGIYAFAKDQNKLDSLCVVTDCEPGLSAEALREHLSAWLYDGIVFTETKKSPAKRETLFRSFGEKLDAVMNLAELSNIRLARLVNVDASLISRFRNGLRIPKSNPALIHLISETCFVRICDQGHLGKLAALMGVTDDMLENSEDGLEWFSSWLCDFNPEDGSIAVEELLDRIDSFSLSTKIPLMSLEQAADAEIRKDRSEVYYGTDGLRRAVIRFLSDAAGGHAKELLLYSDEGMDWMVGDRDFLVRWLSLMHACIRAGIRIKIIHNIDRDLKEMIAAINSWLPLYMSGLIEPYYCQRKNTGMFSHTLFLSPDFACIEAYQVSGAKADGIYHYCTQEQQLKSYRSFYDKMLDECKPLLRTSANPLSGKKAAEVGAGHGIHVLQSTLSLATMPEDIAKSVALRILPDDQRAAFLSEWKLSREIYAEKMKNEFVYECITAADEELLSHNQAMADTSVADACYTPDEYARHMEHMLRLSEQYPNYRFYVLPETLFANIKIIVEPAEVVIEHLAEPRITFTLTHPLMCRAFLSYMEGLQTRYQPGQSKLRQKL
ncbi:MAG: hypothetical protein IJ711_13085 [Lachnospiraceae bacterium]|nr:hypothetical protein [Lachnospiraceae bacterium]